MGPDLIPLSPHLYRRSLSVSCWVQADMLIFIAYKNGVSMIWFHPFVKIMGLHTLRLSYSDNYLDLYIENINVYFNWEFWCKFNYEIFHKPYFKLNSPLKRGITPYRHEMYQIVKYSRLWTAWIKKAELMAKCVLILLRIGKDVKRWYDGED